MIDGWDNAKPVKLSMASQPKPITLVYPYYCNPMFLRRQVQHWQQVGEARQRHMTAIIVDDGSPAEKGAELVLKNISHSFPIRLFRILVDVRWNWLAARNIAMHHADGWCLGTDIDHVIPEETIDHLIFQDHDPGTIYRFKRREWTGEVIHEHPNSWFMTKEMFWRFGGYDEALSGFYGTDGDARRRWVQTAPVRTLPDFLQRHEHIGDSSTTHYKRKQAEDRAVPAMIAKRGKDWKPRVLSFPYHEIHL